MEDRHQAWLIRMELKALTLLPLTSTFNDAMTTRKTLGFKHESLIKRV